MKFQEKCEKSYSVKIIQCCLEDGLLFISPSIHFDRLVGLEVASTTSEQEVLRGSILGLGKVLLGFSIRIFSVAVKVSGFVPGWMAISSPLLHE